MNGQVVINKSLKMVLPTVASDLSYDALEEVQDGTSGWMAFEKATPSTGIYTVKNAGKSKTKVLRWEIGDMTAGQTATLKVKACGSIKLSAACDSIQYLSGPWSITYTDENGVTQKSNGRVNVTVTCP
jgi:hypothetical protein